MQQFNTFPHVFLGAFSFSMRSAQACMIYLAFLSMEITMQLYQDWLPYAFGMIDTQRLFRLLTETGQADRVLPKWPGKPFHPVPTTESTYRMGLLLFVTFVSTSAVLMSPKIAVRHGNMLLTFCALFFFLPLIQFVYTGSYDLGLLFAPIYTMVYGLTVYILIRLKAGASKSNAETTGVAPVKAKTD